MYTSVNDNRGVRACLHRKERVTRQTGIARWCRYKEKQRMTSLGLFLLRLVVGGLFAVHGYPKLFGGAGKGEALSGSTKRAMGGEFVNYMEHGGIGNLTGMLRSMEIPNAPKMAWLLALGEFAGGIALILGWKTRPVALGLAFSQVVAIDKVHAKDGLVGGYEFNATLVGAAAALALTGPGKIAVD